MKSPVSILKGHLSVMFIVCLFGQIKDNCPFSKMSNVATYFPFSGKFRIDGTCEWSNMKFSLNTGFSFVTLG